MNYYNKIKETLINNEINKKVKEYSIKLTKELGKGYSVTNLKYMRQFYLYQKSQQVVDLLPWGHYTILLGIKDIDKLNYYKKESIKLKLSRSELKLRIKNKEYERLPKLTKEKLKNNEELS